MPVTYLTGHWNLYRSFFISFVIGDISSQQAITHLSQTAASLKKKNVLTPVDMPDCLNPAQS